MSLHTGWDNAGKLTAFEAELKRHYDTNTRQGFCALLGVVGMEQQSHSYSIQIVRLGFNPYEAIENMGHFGVRGADGGQFHIPKVIFAFDLLTPKTFMEQMPWKPGTVKGPLDLYDTPAICLPPQQETMPAVMRDENGRIRGNAPSFLRVVRPS